MVAEARTIILRKRIISLRSMMIVLSAIGFAIQVTYVSTQYFRYATTTTVNLNIDDSVFDEVVSVCFRFNDIADVDRVHRETGLNLSRVASLADVNNVFSSLTIKQLFDYTPHENSSIIQSCMYRPSRWQIVEGDGEECRSKFIISRYYTMESICYQFIELGASDLTDVIVDRSPSYKSVFYRINLYPRFKAELVTIIVFDGDLPYRSSEYSYPLPNFDSQLAMDSGKYYLYNMVYAAGSYVYLNLLPPPFDTNCRREQDDTLFVCKKECLREQFAHMDVIPATEIWRQPFDKKVFIHNNVMDEETNNRITEYYDSCRKRCSFRACHLHFSKTVTRAVREKTGARFGFTIMTTSDPDTVVTAVMTMTHIDFLTFIGSCFGTWFGFSFLSLTRSFFGRWKRRTRVDQSPGVKLFEPSPNGMGIHIYVRQ